MFTQKLLDFSLPLYTLNTHTRHTARHVQSIKDIRIIGLDKQSKLGKQKYAHI